MSNFQLTAFVLTLLTTLTTGIPTANPSDADSSRLSKRANISIKVFGQPNYVFTQLASNGFNVPLDWHQLFGPWDNNTLASVQIPAGYFCTFYTDIATGIDPVTGFSYMDCPAPPRAFTGQKECISAPGSPAVQYQRQHSCVICKSLEANPGGCSTA